MEDGWAWRTDGLFEPEMLWCSDYPGQLPNRPHPAPSLAYLPTLPKGKTVPTGDSKQKPGTRL